MAEALGKLRFDLHIPQANSLKDKRRIIKSFRDRLASRYNVSVAEVGSQDHHRRSVIVIAMVGSDRKYVEGSLQKITNMAVAHRDMVVIDSTVEWC